MRKNHKKLMDEGRIKIYNSSIMDFDKKVDGRYFVVGLEILDNMPHDRLHTASSMSLGTDSSKFTHASVIERPQLNPEILNEIFKPIAELNDELINLFLEIWNAKPMLDHVTANKKLKS